MARGGIDSAQTGIVRPNPDPRGRRVDLHQWLAFQDVYFAEMLFAENKWDAIESRLRDARSQIVDQYERVQHAANAWEIQLNATVLVNMLLVFNFMSRQFLMSPGLTINIPLRARFAVPLLLAMVAREMASAVMSMDRRPDVLMHRREHLWLMVKRTGLRPFVPVRCVMSCKDSAKPRNRVVQVKRFGRDN
jgi:hypothetical protein